MTNDPMLEKLLTVSNQDIRLYCGEFTAAEIRAAKAVLAYVRSRMAGNRIVEDVPVAVIHSDGYWTHDAGKDQFDTYGPNMNAARFVVYAAPSGTEVGNNG